MGLTDIIKNRIKDWPAWLKKFKDENYKEKCEFFFKNTEECVSMIAAWVENLNEHETSPESISINCYKLVDKTVLKFILDIPLFALNSDTDDKGQWESIWDYDYTKNEMANYNQNLFFNDTEKETFIQLLHRTNDYFIIVKDVGNFLTVVSEGEKNLKQMEKYVSELWKSSIEDILSKKAEWFSSLFNINVVQCHLKLFKLFQLSKTHKSTQSDIFNIVLQLETVGGNNSIIFDKIHDWLMAVQGYKEWTFDKFVQHSKELLQKNVKIYNQTNDDILRTNFRMTNNRMESMRETYEKWFIQHVKGRRNLYESIINKYAKNHDLPGNFTEKVKDIDSLKMILIEILTFETIKYMYISLLLPQQDTTKDGQYMEKYKRIQKVYTDYITLNPLDFGLKFDYTSLSEEHVIYYQKLAASRAQGVYEVYFNAPPDTMENKKYFQDLESLMDRYQNPELEAEFANHAVNGQFWHDQTEKTVIVSNIRQIICP